MTTALAQLPLKSWQNGEGLMKCHKKMIPNFRNFVQWAFQISWFRSQLPRLMYQINWLSRNCLIPSKWRFFMLHHHLCLFLHLLQRESIFNAGKKHLATETSIACIARKLKAILGHTYKKQQCCFLADFYRFIHETHTLFNVLLLHVSLSFNTWFLYSFYWSRRDINQKLML